MHRLGLWAALVGLVFTVTVSAQRVSPFQNHVRVRVIDRVIIDLNGIRKPAHADGMLAYVAAYPPGNLNICLVEYVGASDEAFDKLRIDLAIEADVKFKGFFEKGHSKREDVEAAAKAVGFTKVDFDKFLLRVR